MKTRLAAAPDVEEIARIHVQSWQAAYRGLLPDVVLDALDVDERREMWKGALAAPGSRVLVAENDSGRVTGFCSLCPSRDSDRDSNHTGEIAALYVEPGAWGQGFGGGLCALALAELRSAGHEEVSLWVFQANSRARQFYESQGFRMDEPTKVDAASGLEEVRYVRSIGGL